MRTLKMRADLPFHLETLLCQKHGYAVSRRQLNEFILFQQSQVIAPTKHKLSLHEIVQANKSRKNAEPPKQLSLAQIDDLTKRCLTIVNSFADPTEHIGPVRARLFSMSQTCHQMEERVFVLQWMDEKFPSPMAKIKFMNEPSVLTGEMPPPDKPGKVWGSVPTDANVCKELERRCDNIISHYQDPYNNVLAVRTRLCNMAKTLKTAPERQYVQDYMDDNFPVEII